MRFSFVPALVCALCACAGPVRDPLTGHATRLIDFSGRAWGARASIAPIGAGPSLWSAETDQLEVLDGGLRLQLVPSPDGAIGTEVFSPVGGATGVCFELEPFGELPAGVVLGLFVYADDRNEIDIEFTDFHGPGAETGYFTVAGLGQHRFHMRASDRPSRHCLAWTANAVSFQSDLAPTKRWHWTGPGPKLGSGNIHINLWLRQGHRLAAPVTVKVLSVTTRR